MTSCSRGDVVLVKFVFADEKGAKQRPGLIVSIDRYHQGRREMILAAITSNIGRLLVGDYKIKGWRESGLLYPSIVTGIVRTIKQDMIAGKLGELPGPPGAAYGRGQTSGDLGALTLLGIMGRRTVETIAGNALRQSRECLEARLGKS